MVLLLFLSIVHSSIGRTFQHVTANRVQPNWNVYDCNSAVRYQQVGPCFTEMLLDQGYNLHVLDIFRLLQRRHAILVPDIQPCAIFQQ